VGRRPTESVAVKAWSGAPMLQGEGGDSEGLSSTVEVNNQTVPRFAHLSGFPSMVWVKPLPWRLGLTVKVAR
jgi:hypothetical protein